MNKVWAFHCKHFTWRWTKEKPARFSKKNQVFYLTHQLVQVTDDTKHLWKHQHPQLCWGLMRDKSESRMKRAGQRGLMTWFTDVIQQRHCKENESSFKWLGRLWVQRQHKTTCGSVRNLRRSWAVCNASVCWLLYLPAMYLHSAGILDWSDLDSQTKITVKFWVMKTFPQGKKKHVLTDKKKKRYFCRKILV